MKIYLKNMVCQGTKYFVILEMRNLGINFKKFESDEIELEEDLSLAKIRKLNHSLQEIGLEAIFRKSNTGESFTFQNTF